MSDENLLNIPVVIAGRTYPVLVAEEELDSIQQINKKLDKEFADLHQRYANKLSKQDILAMLLLTYAKDLHEEKQKNDLTPVTKHIESIETILDKAFSK